MTTYVYLRISINEQESENPLDKILAFCKNSGFDKNIKVNRKENPQLISERVKTSIANSKKKREEAGLPPRVYTGPKKDCIPLTVEEKNKILELKNLGTSVLKISKEMKITYNRIWNFLFRTVEKKETKKHHNKKYQPEDLQNKIKELLSQGKNKNNIAEELGIHYVTVNKKAPKTSTERDKKIRELFQKGLNAQVISNESDIPISTVRRYLTKIKNETS